MAQSSNSLLQQIAVALGRDGGHAIRSNNQWLQIIAGVRTAMSANQCLQVISGRRDNANAVSHLETITSTSVSSMQHGLEVWLDQLSEVAPEPEPLSVTNAEKLGLSPSTPVGTVVSISDGFVVSGAGSAIANIFFHDTGQVFNGKPVYTGGIFGTATEVTVSWTTFLGDDPAARWAFTDVWNGPTLYSSTENVDFPWQVTTWVIATDDAPDSGSLPLPTLTHPAIQRLVAPDSSQGGVAVIGGTQDGVYSIRPELFSIKDAYQLIGSDLAYVQWSDGSPSRWVINFDGDPVYYSLSDVATPDLAGTDKAMMSWNGVLYTKRGTSDGKPYYNQSTEPSSVLLSAIVWRTLDSQWHLTDASGIDNDNSTQNTATPDLSNDWSSDHVVAPAWVNAADDLPATITVTSVSLGELYAGLFVTNDGVTNGSSYVSQPFHGRQYYMGLNGGGSNNMHWDTDYNVWTDDVGVWTTDNVAFPHQGRDNGGGGHTGATFAINYIPDERNWEVV